MIFPLLILRKRKKLKKRFTKLIITVTYILIRKIDNREYGQIGFGNVATEILNPVMPWNHRHYLK